MRKPKEKRAEVCGHVATGETMALAKAQAEAEVRGMVQRIEDGPRLLRVSGRLLFVWPDTYGWAYKLVNPDEPTQRGGRVFGSVHGCDTLAEAIRYGVGHAAQIAWTHDVADDKVFIEIALTQVEGILPAPDRQSMREELTRYFAWQRDYKRLVDAGATNSEAHAHAGSGDGWLPETVGQYARRLIGAEG